MERTKFAELKIDSYHVHDMISHELCHEGINTLICHDSCHENKLSKSDWFYLVNQLEQWRVFNPRAVIKRNPVAAWKVMNLCKDASVRVPGAYFTTCFKRECFKEELKNRLQNAS